MKRKWILLMTLCLLLTACGQSAASGGNGLSQPEADHPAQRFPPYVVTEPEADWGITLKLSEPTSTGGELICTQTGGAVTGELNTGSYYRVEVWNEDGAWEPLPILIENLAWTMEAWSVPLEDTTSWEVDWEFVYGELPAGQYRIAKEFMDFRGTGDYDTAEFFAYFYLE